MLFWTVVVKLCNFQLQQKLEEGAKPEIAPASAPVGPKSTAGGKYIPPTLREGANKGRGESMAMQRKGLIGFQHFVSKGG